MKNGRNQAAWEGAVDRTFMATPCALGLSMGPALTPATNILIEGTDRVKLRTTFNIGVYGI